MTAQFSLEGKLGLDAREFKKGAKQASDAIKDVSDDLDDLPEQGRKAGGKTGDSLGSGLTKGFAALGVGALIAKGLNDAMNIEAGVKRVEAQFALTADEAKRYGELGGDLYADAWGESATDATASIAKVGQQLQDVGSIADDELDDITANVMAVADVFQQDFDSVLRSTGQLLRNDLAADAEEALDMITVAFQQGGDRAGDLLDTIDEYSQHWARLGIEGDEALGLIVEGFQQGFRDGDKLADLFKEFSIRALEDRAVAAFEAIGLAGQATQDAIAAGGTSARGALDDVIRGLRGIEDPLERNRVATELFGTQYEDLGPQVLDVLESLEIGLGDVEGAATDMAETVSDTTESSFMQLRRKAETVLSDVAGMAVGAANIVQGAIDQEGDKAKSGWDQFVDGVMSLPSMSVPGKLGEWFWSESPFADGVEEADAAVAGFSQGLSRLPSYAKPGRDAIGDLGDTAGDTADDIEDVEDAFLDLKGTISDRSAFFDVKDSFDDIARAAEQMADTSDKSFDEQDADVRDHQRAMDDLRLDVIGYIDQLGDIPDDVTSDILALIDQGKLAEAEFAIAMVTRDRNLRIQPVLSDPRGVLNTLRRAGTPDGMLAKGGPALAGKGYIVGEEGPEWFQPNVNGTVFPADVTAAAMASPAPSAMFGTSVAATTFANTSQSVVFNLSVQSLDAQSAGRTIVETLSEFYATGGQRP